jgi:alpha-L-rhamnosidase
MWSSAGLNLSWEHYQMFGDRRALELIYPSAKRWLEFCHSKTTNGLLCNYSEHWGKFLGDWAAPGQRKERGDSREAQYFNNCVYAMNLETVVQMARVLGQEQDAAFYRRRLEDLKPRVHREFFNATNDTYCGGTQVQQAFALLVGIAPEELRPRIAARLKREFVDKEYFDMGSSGLPVLLKHLVEQCADPGLAFGPLARTNEPSYGHFLARGESTWPEYWNVDVPSRIHTCYTGIAGWFTKSLAGIRPDPAHPGFQSFLIRPVLAGDVTFADATIESPYGPIRSRWQRARDRLTLNVTIPPGTMATVHVPTRDASRVTEGGRAIARAAGVAPLGAAGGCAVFKVESGEYSFSAEL